MIGTLVAPPSAGSPRRRRCSLTRRERRFGSRRGRQAFGSTSTSTRPVVETPSSPKPRNRQSLCTRGSRSRAERRVDIRTASQNLIARRRPINPLQHEFEIECELQLADDDERRLLPAQRHEIATADLALHVEPKQFEEALYRSIERCFPLQFFGVRGRLIGHGSPVGVARPLLYMVQVLVQGRNGCAEFVNAPLTSAICQAIPKETSAGGIR